MCPPARRERLSTLSMPPAHPAFIGSARLPCRRSNFEIQPGRIKGCGGLQDWEGERPREPQRARRLFLRALRVSVVKQVLAV